MRKAVFVLYTLAMVACVKSEVSDHEAPTPVAAPMQVTRGQVYGYAQDLKKNEDAGVRFNTEEYGRFEENPFLRATDNPLSTFSIDVDRASYANVRRYITSGQRPPHDAVRIEEMINYFTYDYPEPAGAPFSVTTELAQCPWNHEHKLLLVGLQGKRIHTENLPPTNLVFLIGGGNELATVKLRYKEPDGDTSKLLTQAVADTTAATMSDNIRLAASVAQLGMLLRDSPNKGNASMESVLELAQSVRTKDVGGYRRDFVALVQKAESL
jgi:hypothetical protein